jgi:outer membrane protein assembly factor BamB
MAAFLPLTLLLTLCLQGSVGRKGEADLVKPIVRAWRYATPSLAGVPVAADPTLVVMAMAGGRFVAVDPRDGSLVWTAEPGGRVRVPALLATDRVYVATSRTGEPPDCVVRCLDRSTGLAVWLRELRLPVVAPMELADGRLYVGCADGMLYCLNAANGATLWTFATGAPVRGQVVFDGHAVVFGSDDGALHAVDIERGTELWRVDVDAPVVGAPVLAGRRLFVGTTDGSVLAFDASSRKRIWRVRTGAAIEASPVLVGDRLLVASFDNFVYMLDARSGSTTWKRRLRGRLISPPLVCGEYGIVAPLRDDKLTVVETRTGSRVSAFGLDQGDEIVAPPTLVGPLLLLPTEAGLTAARIEVGP